MKKIILFFVIALISISIQAQITFQKTIGTTFYESGSSIQQTSDGGYILVGQRGEYSDGFIQGYLVKLNSIGNIEWTLTVGANNYANLYSVQQTSDGGYIAAGVQSISVSDHSPLLVKINSSGGIQWSKYYSGNNWDEFSSVRQTSDGGYILTGHAMSFGAGGQDMYIIKTNSVGDTLFTNVIGGTSYDYGDCAIQTLDSNYAVLGNTLSFGAGGSYDASIIKLNALGHIIWAKTYGGTGDEKAGNLVQTSNGSFVFTGFTNSAGSGGYDIFLIKTNSNGDTLWTKTYGGPQADYGNSVAITSDKGYIISGLTQSFGGGACLLKTDSMGNLLWSKIFTSYGFYFAQETTDGGFIAAGNTSTYGAGSYDVYFAKTSAQGNSGCNQSNASFVTSTYSPIISTPAYIESPTNIYVYSGSLTTGHLGQLTTLCSNAAVEENDRNSVSLFPNPAENQISLRAGEGNIQYIDIINAFGDPVRPLTLHPYSGSSIDINIEFLPSGMYFMVMSDFSGNKLVRKFIKR